MPDSSATRAFLLAEVEALAPFDFVATSPAGDPLRTVEVTRGQDGKLRVQVPGRPPMVPELPVPVRSALRDRGFTNENASDPLQPWVRVADGGAAAVDLVFALLGEVFGAAPDARIDVTHGSHRAAYEARAKLAATRERVEKLVRGVAKNGVDCDADGDFCIPFENVRVTVAPRVSPAGPVIVRVFAITNVGVQVTPELGLFLARLNFGLVFGRFALDVERQAIWVDETLLGDHFTDEELRFTIDVVAQTADQWDDRLKQMFGGLTYQEAAGQRPADGLTKPGQASYQPGQGIYL